MSSEWINVKDKLPEDGQEVLFYFYTDDYIDPIKIGIFYTKPEEMFTYTDDGCEFAYYVKNSHVLWMPLPAQQQNIEKKHE